MIIYLYGPDSYRRQEKLNEYIERYKEKYASGAGFFYLDKEDDFVRFKDFCKSLSLFEASKLGLVFNFSDLEKADLKEFNSVIKENLKNKDLTLILNSDKKPTKDFSFLLKEPVISHNFDALEGSELKKFLDIEIKKRKIELDQKIKDLFLSGLSNNTWEIILALDKLSLLDEKKIDQKILEKHIDLLPALDIFGHINKMREGYSVGNRLSALEELYERGADSAMIFNVFAASPYLNKEQKITMADYDAEIKSGKLEYDEVLLDMMLG
ncbi:MAG: DNA polymerase III subunit delta [Minisyncoccota bacterium]